MMDKTITVQTDAGPVVVRKLAMYDYADLLRSLKKLPGEFGKFIDGNSAEALNDKATLLAEIPTLIADALPEFCAVLASATDKDADFHGQQLDLADNVEILAAALELNDYKKIQAAIKKITAPGQVPTDQQAAEEPEEPKKNQS
jgi:hypothetical protein